MAGKGDKWRKTDFKKFYDNLNDINLTNPETKVKEVKKIKNKIRYVYG